MSNRATQDAIVLHLAQVTHATVNDIVAATRAKRGSVMTELGVLWQAGKIVRAGARGRSGWMLYALRGKEAHLEAAIARGEHLRHKPVVRSVAPVQAKQRPVEAPNEGPTGIVPRAVASRTALEAAWARL